MGGSYRPLSVPSTVDRDKEREKEKEKEKISTRPTSGTFKSPADKEKGPESVRKNPYLKSPTESVGGGTGTGTGTEKKVSSIQSSGSRDRRIGRRAYDVEGDDDVVEF